MVCGVLDIHKFNAVHDLVWVDGSLAAALNAFVVVAHLVRLESRVRERSRLLTLVRLAGKDGRRLLGYVEGAPRLRLDLNAEAVQCLLFVLLRGLENLPGRHELGLAPHGRAEGCPGHLELLRLFGSVGRGHAHHRLRVVRRVLTLLVRRGLLLVDAFLPLNRLLDRLCVDSILLSPSASEPVGDVGPIGARPGCTKACLRGRFEGLLSVVLDRVLKDVEQALVPNGLRLVSASCSHSLRLGLRGAERVARSLLADQLLARRIYHLL